MDKDDNAAAIEHLQKAVVVEDALPYMEPAFWPIPVRPTLDATLLQAGKFAEAELVFREDVQRWLRNGWGLFGLEQSLRVQGKTDSTDSVQPEFNEAWQRADVKLGFAWY